MAFRKFTNEKAESKVIKEPEKPDVKDLSKPKTELPPEKRPY